MIPGPEVVRGRPTTIGFLGLSGSGTEVEGKLRRGRGGVGWGEGTST